MKKIVNLRSSLVILLAVAPLGLQATVFFSDDFTHGSTTNQLSIPGGTPTASSTSYDYASSKDSRTSVFQPRFLSMRLGGPTTSGHWQIQALFTTNPVALVSPGDYVDLDVVFTNGVNTNGTGTLLVGNVSPLWIGLYNSGAAPGTVNPPVAGALANAGLTTAATSPYATGNCQLWAGYVGQVYSGAGSRIITRPVQNGAGDTSANQELCGNGVSGGTFVNPNGTALVTSPSYTFALPTDAASTMSFRITLDPGGSGNLIISNAVFSGSDESGPMVFSNIVSTSTILASSFDGLCIGVFSHNGSTNPQMDIASITVSGQITVNTNPPTITAQPVPVTVTSNGSCAFFISATGVGVSYQWARNGTNLLNGGNISGATSSQLVISPVGPDDVLSGANGYYCIATASGGYSTNSVTNSLVAVTSTNLTWAGPAGAGGDIWNLNTNANWFDQNNQAATFTFGDPVIFNDTGANQPAVTLSGSYLSPASVTITGGTSYSFLGTGSIAGPGNMIYAGSGLLTINNLNTYSGGTIISNSLAYLFLNNWRGLGTGPLTLAQAGGAMETTIAGSGSTGLPNDINVQDDFTILYDASSTYGLVLFGNLSGNADKTLTINYFNSTGAVSRVRISGANTVYNGKLNLVDSRTVWATYQSTGSETYNGVIYGSGALMEKGADTYLNGANTFTGGTFLANGAGPLGLGIDSTGPAGAPTTSPLGTGPLYLTIDSTTATTGTGWLLASGGARTVGNAIQFPNGTNNLTLGIGGTNDLTFTGPLTLNGNDLVVSSTFKARTLQVTNRAATTFSGVISDLTNGVSAVYGLLKTGDGALYLNATNTYTGSTTNNSSTTNRPGLLAGSGVVTGPVVVMTNSSIGGGSAAAIGTLTISNNLTLRGNVFIRVNKSLVPGQSNDVIYVTGTQGNIGAGTVTVTNLGPDLVAGDRFVLFKSGLLTGGGSLTVTGGGAGVTWNNNLATDGSISVASVVVPKPVITNTVVSGGNVILNGNNGAGSAGGTFYVLSSTNVGATLSAWLPISTNTYGPGGTFSVTNAILPGVPHNFYMLKQ